MDFFEQQARAHRKTKWLVLYFIVAVMLLIASVYFISLVVFAGVHAKQHHGYDDAPIQFVLWDPEVFLGATLGVLAVIFIGSAYKTNELSAGGSARTQTAGPWDRRRNYRARLGAK